MYSASLATKEGSTIAPTSYAGGFHTGIPPASSIYGPTTRMMSHQPPVYEMESQASQSVLSPEDYYILEQCRVELVSALKDPACRGLGRKQLRKKLEKRLQLDLSSGQAKMLVNNLIKEVAENH